MDWAIRRYGNEEEREYGKGRSVAVCSPAVCSLFPSDGVCHHVLYDIVPQYDDEVGSCLLYTSSSNREPTTVCWLRAGSMRICTTASLKKRRNNMA